MTRSVLLFLCFIMLSCSKTGEPVGDLDIINVDINDWVDDKKMDEKIEEKVNEALSRKTVDEKES